MGTTSLRRGTQEEGNTDYFTGCPIGGGFIWFGLADKIPSNCRICENQTLAMSDFAKLNTVLGGSWGFSGTNFNLPDLRGRFPRGVDGGAGRDVDRATRTNQNSGQSTGDKVGSVQTSGTYMPNHSHYTVRNTNGGGGKSYAVDGTVTTTNYATAGSFANDDSYTVITGTSAEANTLKTSGPIAPADNETRPHNSNVYFVIRVS